MASHVATNVRSTISRDWLDVEPKVYAALVSGSAVAALLIILSLLHVAVDPAWQAFLPELAGVLAAYAKASTHKGDLLARVERDGLADARHLADAAAGTVAPQAAPAVSSLETALTDLGLSPAQTTAAAPAVAE